MSVIYIIVAFLITIGSFIVIGAGASIPSYYGIGSTVGGTYVIGGLVILIVGNLGWRLICELIVVQFSIHDRLVSIDNKLGSGSPPPPRDATYGQAAPPARGFSPPPPAYRETGVPLRPYMKRCVQCGEQIPIASEECQFCRSKQAWCSICARAIYGSNKNLRLDSTFPVPLQFEHRCLKMPSSAYPFPLHIGQSISINTALRCLFWLPMQRIFGWLD